MFRNALILVILLIGTPALADHVPDFGALDTDQDDVLTNNELAQELADLKSTLSAFSDVDQDADGVVSRDEYVAWVQKLHE